jgi:hypothetical protein
VLEGFIELHKTWLHKMPPMRYEYGSNQYLTKIIANLLGSAI